MRLKDTGLTVQDIKDKVNKCICTTKTERRILTFTQASP